jgi:hypothetical protein
VKHYHCGYPGTRRKVDAGGRAHLNRAAGVAGQRMIPKVADLSNEIMRKIEGFRVPSIQLEATSGSAMEQSA